MRVHEPGEPGCLRWEEVEVPAPGPGEVLLRHTHIGVNFLDVYYRNGLYPAPQRPFVPGAEGIGVVEAVGAGVVEPRVGERVGYATVPLGAYAERRIIAADKLVLLPAGVSDRDTAALLLKGLTAHYLLRRSYCARPNDTILWHAAAGGVGMIAAAWARHLGVRVIGTAGSDEKAERARAAGCAETIVYTREDFVARVRELTGGRGVDAVYDSVGADTFMKSLDCLRPLGTLVSFGQSSGPVPLLDVRVLASKGSLFLTRPTLFHYCAARADLLGAAAELFELISRGIIRAYIHAEYRLRDAAAAHRALESRRTCGSLIMVP